MNIGLSDDMATEGPSLDLRDPSSITALPVRDPASGIVYYYDIRNIQGHQDIMGPNFDLSSHAVPDNPIQIWVINLDPSEAVNLTKAEKLAYLDYAAKRMSYMREEEFPQRIQDLVDSLQSRLVSLVSTLQSEASKDFADYKTEVQSRYVDQSNALRDAFISRIQSQAFSLHDQALGALNKAVGSDQQMKVVEDYQGALKSLREQIPSLWSSSLSSFKKDFVSKLQVEINEKLAVYNSDEMLLGLRAQIREAPASLTNAMNNVIFNWMRRLPAFAVDQ